LRFHSRSEYRPLTGLKDLVSLSTFRELFSTLRRDSTQGSDLRQRFHPLTVQRPQPFSGSRRVAPLHAYPPCFMRERPWVLKSSKRFPHRPPHKTHRLALSSMLFLLRLQASSDRSSEEFSLSVSPYPTPARFRREAGRCSLDLIPSRSPHKPRCTASRHLLSWAFSLPSPK
jgi:hypothetical protein